MSKKKKTYIILVLIILIIGGIYYWKSRPVKITYTTEKAKVGTIAKTVSATGEIKPEIESDLSFKISGRVESIFVDVGDNITKGQKIAVIDKGVLLEQLEQAKHELEVQNETLKNMKKRDGTYNHAQREAQRAQIRESEGAINEIKKQIGDTILYSPIEGTVTRKNIEIGENAVANTSVLVISGLGEPFIEIDVSESDVIDVKIEQKAKISFDALPSTEKLEGEVFEIEPASTVIQDVVYYKAKLKLSKWDERLKIGMSVDADINTAEKNNAVMIPLRAVKNDGNQDFVEILKPENKTERVNVQAGLKGDDGMVEIVSGLKGGEDVVVLSSEK
ncbi:MAG TPA: efflux RND transporter periplasmic adaptor subunit [Candidatus Moranbacteria bacterium]|nr:efflux RND transporter periplasmic adaptor subunit [Candidatus Moranbacteria bacterium]